MNNIVHALDASVRRCLRASLLVAAVVSLVGPLHAAPESQPIERYTGTAYARSGEQVLYREVHYVFEAQGEQRQLVLYRCLNGDAFGRKLLHDSPASATPAFDFVDGRTGYREGVRGNGGARIVYVQMSHDAVEHSQNLTETNSVIDAGFDTYVRTHWDTLGITGDEVRFLVPSRLGFLKVRLIDGGSAVEHGQALRKVRIQLDAWYSFVLPQIDLSYTAENHRLWRFEGTGSIRDNHSHNQDVRIEFPEDARQINVPQAELNVALAAPLVGRCDG